MPCHSRSPASPHTARKKKEKVNASAGYASAGWKSVREPAVTRLPSLAATCLAALTCQPALAKVRRPMKRPMVR